MSVFAFLGALCLPLTRQKRRFFFLAGVRFFQPRSEETRALRPWRLAGRSWKCWTSPSRATARSVRGPRIWPSLKEFHLGHLVMTCQCPFLYVGPCPFPCVCFAVGDEHACFCPKQFHFWPFSHEVVLLPCPTWLAEGCEIPTGVGFPSSPC